VPAHDFFSLIVFLKNKSWENFFLDPVQKSFFSLFLCLMNKTKPNLRKRRREETNTQKYCALCYNENVTDSVTCRCNHWICSTCANTPSIALDDWLESGSRCFTCDIPVCRACVVICYECENDPNLHGSSRTYCNRCKRMQNRGCADHTWYVCKDHNYAYRHLT
jgi:hypothetical protein